MRPRWCAPQQASIPTTQRGSPAANLMTPSRLRRRRRTTRPAASSPTTLQLFLPRSIPSTAICMVFAPAYPVAPQSSAARRRGGPFHKANQDRRHRIPKQRHWVTNWAVYDAGLRARGSLTVWFSTEAIEAWRAEPRTTPGGQPHYSSLAIATALTLKTVFRLALRQTVRGPAAQAATASGVNQT